MSNEAPLTLEDRAAILDHADPVDRFMAVWRVVLARHGINLDDVPPGGIDATAYRLPKESATWAAEAVVSAAPQHLRPTFAMEWANKGPGYHEDTP